MKKSILLVVLFCTLCHLKAQPVTGSKNRTKNGGAGFVGTVQGAQPAADQAALGTLVSRRMAPGSADVGSIVFTSLGTGEKTWQVTADTKVMRNGYASNLKYAEPGDTASVVLKQKGPFVRFLTLTSPQTAASTSTLTPEQAQAKKAATSEKLLKWHSDLAAKGDPRGQFEMGRRYENGDGVETNKTKAIEYYTKAGAGGNEDAKIALTKLTAKP